MKIEKNIHITVHGSQENRETALVCMLIEAIEERSIRKVLEQLNDDDLISMAQCLHGRMYDRVRAS